jgi:putative membrane protein insertion efficiency factor
MGHRHTPEEFSGARGSGGADGGFAAAAEERVTAKQSVAVRAALLALRFYKSYLSILVGGSCRFEPTCSRYAYEAIERFGVMRGVWLGLKRLLRCHPFSRRFGFDPVPEKWEEMPTNSAAAEVLKTEAHS